MKTLTILILLMLTACSVCNIPTGKFSTFTSGETITSLHLTPDEYLITHETWLAGDYDRRSITELNGTWSCVGSSGIFRTEKMRSIANYIDIGENPLGLATNTKALIFETSGESILSKQILYKKTDIK